MEKASLQFVFLFSLIVIASRSTIGDAREMVNGDANCIGGKCPEGKKNCDCLPLVAHIMEPGGVCSGDIECMKYCLKQCKPGTCVCACNFGCTCTC